MLILLMLLAVAAPACGKSGSSDSSAGTRTILTDFNHDEFATSIMGYFPRVTAVHPGDKIVFKQAWTGEAHTVTLGTLVKPLGDFLQPYLTGAKPIPEGDEPPELEALSQPLPPLFGDKDANQTASQPCYLNAAPLPSDEKACPRVAQPEFTGKEVFYNSGFIPYEGNNGNKYSMTLAKDVAPGTYFYMCLLHGGGMGGYLEVRPASAAVPSQAAVNSLARTQLNGVIKSLAAENKKALAKKFDFPPSMPHFDVAAGASTPDSEITFGLVNEFYPKKFTTKVGQKVTWLIFGHTVSFHVPKYGPQLRVDPKTNEVHLNLKAYNPVGVDIPEGEPSNKATEADAGNYDGSKYLSSGAQFNVLYSITFTKVGTYQYACTIHPRMVGTLTVTG
jgi:plastocyanin